ncbi:hypothetical protein Tco_0741162 [Tanacetum coccineum]
MARSLKLCLRPNGVVSENNIDRNDKKVAGFLTEVTGYLHKEMGQKKRSYESINCKWKNRIRPKPEPVLPKNQGQPETTSHDTSDSTHVGLDLNDEATDSVEDEDVQEVRPMGRDKAKKKGSTSASCLSSSERELEIQDERRQEDGELEILKLARKEKEIALQQQMFEFQHQEKFEKDVTPLKSSSSGMVTMGCYVKVQ